jgi:hypothetical protein
MASHYLRRVIRIIQAESGDGVIQGFFLTIGTKATGIKDFRKRAEGNSALKQHQAFPATFRKIEDLPRAVVFHMRLDPHASESGSKLK